MTQIGFDWLAAHAALVARLQDKPPPAVTELSECVSALEHVLNTDYPGVVTARGVYYDPDDLTSSDTAANYQLSVRLVQSRGRHRGVHTRVFTYSTWKERPRKQGTPVERLTGAPYRVLRAGVNRLSALLVEIDRITLAEALG